MTAAARKLADSPPENGGKPAARPSPVAVFHIFLARAEARATLWRCGEFDLPEAVDGLQASAVASGLIAEIGQDAVQAVMALAFAMVRDDLAVTNFTAGAAQSADND